MNTTRQRIRDYYQRQALPASSTRLLVRQIRAAETPGAASAPPSARAGRARVWSVRLAAAAVVVVLLAGAWAGGLAVRDHRLAAAVAREVAVNHAKQLRVDYPVARFDELGAAMGKLDFTPLRPGTLDADGYTLAGARYCTLQGRIAAQVRLTDGAGRRLTLYEAQCDGPLGSLGRRVHEVGGVRVTLWNEGGLLLALAEPLPRSRTAADP